MLNSHLRCFTVAALGAAALSGGAALTHAQDGVTPTAFNPFPEPIRLASEALTVQIAEFASLPDSDSSPARMMRLVDEPGTGRLFVNDMRGPLYTVSYAGHEVALYLDIADPRWALALDDSAGEKGFQSFAIHPQFAQLGTPGYGKLYTYLDTRQTAPTPDFTVPERAGRHHLVLLEWTAADPAAAAYDGGPPRELMRVRQPFGNHNGGQLGFNPRAVPGDPDFGLLYVGSADGGAAGDPFDVAQDLGSIFGKLLRLDPLGSDSANGQYGIPAANPFASDGDPDTLGEIFAYGFRNPQRFGWDLRYGDLFVADIGQDVVEEVSLVTAGANLGWNDWEGSFRYLGNDGSRAITLVNPRSDPGLTYPIAEYDHRDPLLRGGVAVTGVVVYRDDAIPELENLIVFGDFPSGEVFYVPADPLPHGGQADIRRMLFRYQGATKTLLELIRDKNASQGRSPAGRADLRFGQGSEGQVFLLNKRDGTIRRLVGSPRFGTRTYEFVLRENVAGSGKPITLGRVAAVVADNESQLQHAIKAGDAETPRFALHVETGTLAYVGPGEDFEGGPQRYDLTVAATDGLSSSATATVAVVVADVNEAPVFFESAYGVQLGEGRRGPVVLASVAAIDPENAGPVRYALQTGASPRFAIGASTGVLIYTGPGEDLQAGSRSYALTVVATDPTGLQSQVQVTVAVTASHG